MKVLKGEPVTLKAGLFRSVGRHDAMYREVPEVRDRRGSRN
jgi:hypothetical protein